MTSDTQITSKITGREPRLSISYGQQGQRRLNIMGLANMLNLLPAHGISLPAFEEGLRSDAFYVRYSAARKLSERGGRDARILMQKLLPDDEAPSRPRGARPLYRSS